MIDTTVSQRLQFVNNKKHDTVNGGFLFAREIRKGSFGFSFGIAEL